MRETVVDNKPKVIKKKSGLTDFLHGIEVIDIDTGSRPIRTVASSVIGVVGTAPEADKEAFPENTPVLIAGSRIEAAKLGTKGTLPKAMDAIFDQYGALVVVIVVPEGTTEQETITNFVGGVDPVTGQYKGVHVLLGAESICHVEPKILVVPKYSATEAVAKEMETIVDRLRAMFILDGPNTTDQIAIEYRKKFSSKRFYMVDPWVKIWDVTTNAEVIDPASARVAGVISLSDYERGFWWSPSNRPIYGILGSARPVDFKLGDKTCRANFLNANEVTTIIQQNGYILWGNRTCLVDPKWAFINVVRTADILHDSLQRAHMWAVDRNLVKNYFEQVTEGVNNGC